MEAGGNLMSDSEMTRIPYGRGFFYLMHADGMIRKATHGKHTLDDVMQRLLEEEKNNPDRITSYNVCYTKLLRHIGAGNPWVFIILNRALV